MTDWNALLGRLRAAEDQLQLEVERSDRERREFEHQQAEKARAGELGPDRRQLQRRIDAGTTTLADALAGRDDTPEAQRVRGFARTNLDRLAQNMPPELREQAEELRDQGGPR